MLVVGDVQPDLTLRPGGSAPVMSGGGTAANTAVALARLGVAVTFVGAVGDDWSGRGVLADLRREGIDTTPCVVVRDEPTPLVIALVGPDGEPTLHRWPPDRGADWHLRPDDVAPALVHAAGWLHASGICLTASPAREAVLQAMALARGAGIPVSFDMNFRAERRADDPGLQPAFAAAIAACDVLFGHGEEELMVWSGLPSVAAAAQALCGGRRTVVARLGGRGVLVCSPAGVWSAPAFPTTVVDATGGGDAFNGAFIAATRAGASTRDAARSGLAAGALAVAREGARASPTRAALEAFLAARGGA